MRAVEARCRASREDPALGASNGMIPVRDRLETCGSTPAASPVRDQRQGCFVISLARSPVRLHRWRLLVFGLRGGHGFPCRHAGVVEATRARRQRQCKRSRHPLAACGRGRGGDSGHVRDPRVQRRVRGCRGSPAPPRYRRRRRPGRSWRPAARPRSAPGWPSGPSPAWRSGRWRRRPSRRCPYRSAVIALVAASISDWLIWILSSFSLMALYCAPSSSLSWVICSLMPPSPPHSPGNGARESFRRHGAFGEFGTR